MTPLWRGILIGVALEAAVILGAAAGTELAIWLLR